MRIAGEAVQDDGRDPVICIRTSRKLVAMGMPMSVLKAEGIFEKVIAIKYDVRMTTCSYWICIN